MFCCALPKHNQSLQNLGNYLAKTPEQSPIPEIVPPSALVALPGSFPREIVNRRKLERHNLQIRSSLSSYRRLRHIVDVARPLQRNPRVHRRPKPRIYRQLSSRRCPVPMFGKKRRDTALALDLSRPQNAKGPRHIANAARTNAARKTNRKYRVFPRKFLDGSLSARNG